MYNFSAISYCFKIFIIQVLPTVDRADPPVKKVNAIDTHQAALATTPAPSASPAPPSSLVGGRARARAFSQSALHCETVVGCWLLLLLSAAPR